ncbi:MAG TPA: EF-hand domain-containing protein [Stellaceae bacterium]|nr:EF-hand domain-containing protein [Stellaceae bacterium]
MNNLARYAFAATAGLFIAACYLPAQAAPTATDSAAADTITFEQYRDWRMHFIEERQLQIAAELTEKNLSDARRTGLERQKAYYDYFAAMPAAERDQRFRERFNEIDTNHDGVIDRNERAAWHDKQRAFYEHSNYRHEVDNAARR